MTQSDQNKQKVALVLSSGGARGLAHIGVIESLIANGYQISSIAGSSIGAVIGAFYACGRLEDYKNWAINLDKLDVFKLLDFTFSVQGFVKGERVFKTLEQIIPDVQLEDMNIPLSVVVTDLDAKQSRIFESGSMYDAIKASVAIPTVIKPVMIGGREHIDGGVTNPIPIEYVKRTRGDIMVVSNVNAMVPPRKISKPPQPEQAESYNQKIQSFLSNWSKMLPGSSSEPVKKKLGFFDLLNESIDIMQDRLTSLLLDKYQPEHLVNISREACGTFEFYRAAELIEEGRVAMEKVLQSDHLSTAKS